MKKNKKSAFSKNKKTTNNNSKSFFEKIKNYYYKIEESVKKNPKKQFIYFVLGFVLVYLILTEIVYAFPKGFFENFVGEQVNFY